MESFPTETIGQTPSLAEDPALGLDPRAKFRILLAVLLALFLGALDQTIVGTALPTIVTRLGGNEYYVWVITIYLLTSTITVPFYGKLSDLYGRKPMLMIGITIFLIGSALSGLSQTMSQLILFRGVQGMGAGALFPISLAVIGDMYTPKERGRYQGLFGAVFGVSALIGPALGGFITDHFGWHWIFFVNIPIGIASLVVLTRLLPTVKRPNASRNLDYLGGGVFILAISTLLIGLTNKQSADWATPQVGGLLAISAFFTAIFVAVERFAREPIVPLSLFKNRTYAASIVSTFFVSFGFFGAIIFLPRWFQFVRGESATESGYQTLALLVGLILSSIIAGILVSKTGRYKAIILFGLATMTIGLTLMTQLRADTPLPTLWFWMFVTGVGIGPTMSVFTIVVQNAVAFRFLGVATSNLTFFRQIGGSVGLAITGTVFSTTLQQQVPVQLVAAGVPQQVVSGIGTSGGFDLNQLTGVGQDLGAAILASLPAPVKPVIEPLIGDIVLGIHQAFSLAVASTFQVAVITTICAFVAALAIREIPLRATVGEELPMSRAEHVEHASMTDVPASPTPA